MAAVGLARESSDDASKELAYDYQIERLEAYGCQWIFGDRVSGRRDDRKGLEQALQKIRTGEANELVVTHFTRLARSVLTAHRVIEELRRYGAKLTVLDSPVDLSTPEGRFAYQLRAGLAELEAELGAERQRVGWQNSRNKARPRAPVFGYLIQDGRYTPYQWEIAEAIIAKFDQIKSLNATQVWIHREFAHLKDAPRQQRPPFTARGLKLWLLNPVLIGHVKLGDRLHLDQHPGLINRAKQDEFRQLINSRICGIIRTAERRHPYSGLVWCATCGARAAKLSNAKDNGTGDYIYYRCSRVRLHQCQETKRVREEAIESAVIEAIRQQAQQITDWLMEPEHQPAPPTDSRVAEIQAKISRLLPLVEMDPRISEVIADLEREITNLSQPKEKPSLNLEEGLIVLSVLLEGKIWETLNPTEKYEQLSLIIKQIWIQGGAVVGVEFQPWLQRS